MAMSERKLRWMSRIGVIILRVLGATWRFTVTDPSGTRPFPRRRTVVFALWHGELLPLIWHHRGEGICIVISEHTDGEIIARVARALGYRTVRGSTSRGGGRALIGLIREIGEGHDVAVTPDGPRGPALVFAPGAAIAAQRSGAPIVLVRASASSAWRLRSWDRFMIPRPFARVSLTYGTPDHLSATTPREAAGEAARLGAALQALGSP